MKVNEGISAQEAEEIIKNAQKTLGIAKILIKNGMNTTLVVKSKKVNGVKQFKLLKELVSVWGKVDVKRVIEEYGLDGDYEFGRYADEMNKAYKGRGKYTMTEKEKRLAENYGVVKERNPIDNWIEIVTILSENGVELGEFDRLKVFGEDGHWNVIKNIKQEGIDINKIIDENGLDGDYRLWYMFIFIELGYWGTGQFRTMTEKQRERVKKLGVIDELKWKMLERYEEEEKNEEAKALCERYEKMLAEKEGLKSLE